ncbi:MAG: hypothetical protein AAF909_06690, partial [Pseudomonadota bacterium]
HYVDFWSQGASAKTEADLRAHLDEHRAIIGDYPVAEAPTALEVELGLREDAAAYYVDAPIGLEKRYGARAALRESAR